MNAQCLRLLRRLNEIMNRKHLAQGLAQKKCSRNVSCCNFSYLATQALVVYYPLCGGALGDALKDRRLTLLLLCDLRKSHRLSVPPSVCR